MAGFCGHTEAVRVFCKDLKERIVNENKARMNIVGNSEVKPTFWMETDKQLNNSQVLPGNDLTTPNDKDQLFPPPDEDKKR